MAKYHSYIKLAIEIGYYFDFDRMVLVRPSGSLITPKLYGSQRYPSITLCSGINFKDLHSKYLKRWLDDIQ